jgi:SAM-dependent methyltransferase
MPTAWPKPSLPPIISALLAQLLALGVITVSGLSSPLLEGLVAALLGLALRLPWWWLPINLLFPSAILFTLSLSLPPWIFLLVFTLLLLFNWNSAGGRVPLYLSNRDTWEGINQLLPQRGGLRFIDLGSGLGGTLFYLSRQHPDCHFSGIESSPLPFAISWLRLRLAGLHNVELRFGDLWRENLGQYDVVYTFLSPVPMSRIYSKCREEMGEKGGVLISNSFSVARNPPESTTTLSDRRKTTLYRWRFPPT